MKDAKSNITTLTTASQQWLFSRYLCWACWRSQDCYMNKYPHGTSGDGGRRWKLLTCFILSLASHWNNLLMGKLPLPHFQVAPPGFLSAVQDVRSWSLYFIQVQEWQGKRKGLANLLHISGQWLVSCTR